MTLRCQFTWLTTPITFTFFLSKQQSMLKASTTQQMRNMNMWWWNFKNLACKKSHIYAFYEVKIFFPFCLALYFISAWKHKSQFSSHKKRYGSTFKTSENAERKRGHKFELSSFNAFFSVSIWLTLSTGPNCLFYSHIYGVNIFELSSVAFFMIPALHSTFIMCCL